MIKLSNTIAEILEYNGFSYNEVEEQDGKYYIELNNGTPEGEDWWVTVCFDGTDKSFVNAVEEITTNFDIDEEVEDNVSDTGKIAYDFEIDSDLIYASMFSQYGVEIDKEKIHWFKFIAMFKCLKDTELNDLMYYRTVDIAKLPKQQRADMRKLQDKYRIRKVTAQRKEELIACFGDEWKKHI